VVVASLAAVVGPLVLLAFSRQRLHLLVSDLIINYRRCFILIMVLFVSMIIIPFISLLQQFLYAAAFFIIGFNNAKAKSTVN
jgi:hypothetical protein